MSSTRRDYSPPAPDPGAPRNTATSRHHETSGIEHTITAGQYSNRNTKSWLQTRFLCPAIVRVCRYWAICPSLSESSIGVRVGDRGAESPCRSKRMRVACGPSGPSSARAGARPVPETRCSNRYRPVTIYGSQWPIECRRVGIGPGETPPGPVSAEHVECRRSYQWPAPRPRGTSYTCSAMPGDMSAVCAARASRTGTQWSAPRQYARHDRRRGLPAARPTPARLAGRAATTRADLAEVRGWARTCTARADQPVIRRPAW